MNEMDILSTARDEAISYLIAFIFVTFIIIGNVVRHKQRKREKEAIDYYHDQRKNND